MNSRGGDLASADPVGHAQSGGVRLDTLRLGAWASDIRRDHSTSYQVETRSLCDLLSQHNAPREVGFLSVDTEGSELEILTSIDFSAHTIHVIKVEHNHKQELRTGIHSLLLHNGYKRVFEHYSEFDDWYVLT